MTPLDFTKALFLTSFAHANKILDFKNQKGKVLPEIAIVGRSNVGKSSLINFATKKQGLAKTSSTPGKTTLFNFFNIDDTLILVDLPGYGYAVSDKGQKETWAKEIDAYFKGRKNLKALLLLLDIRRLPSDEDLAMIAFAKEASFSLLFIFTKTDKLNRSELYANLEKNLEIAQTAYGHPVDYVLFSIKDPSCRIPLIKKIRALV